MRHGFLVVLLLLCGSMMAQITADSVMQYVSEMSIEDQIAQLNRMAYASDLADSIRIQLTLEAQKRALSIGDVPNQALALHTRIPLLNKAGYRQEAIDTYTDLRRLLEQNIEATEKQVSSQIFLRNLFMLGFVLILNLAFWAYNRYIIKKQDTDKLAIINTEIQAKARELEETNIEIQRAKKKMEGLARTDPLTHLLNRRGMEERIRYEIQRFKRYQKSFSIIISDIDDFKKVNDTWGHDCGDYVLGSVAELMSEVVRKIDIVCRWGGEEFLLLLPETDLEGGAILAEKIKDLISITPYQFKDIDLQFSMTFGVSIFDGSKNVDDVIKEADEALYYGKTHGKNQVVKHGMY